MSDTAHAKVMAAVYAAIDATGDAEEISPRDVAWRAYQVIKAGMEPDDRVRYVAVEQLKAMARKALARRFTADGEDNAAHQGEMFSGALQDRYPVPRRTDQEPAYKRIDCLTELEGEWNCEQLRKSARARLEHADALRAYLRARTAA